MSCATSTSQLPPLIITPPGLYRHYKGMLYEVLDTVRHSETLEPLIERFGRKTLEEVFLDIARRDPEKTANGA